MNISIKNTNNLASAMEITKYPNSPLIKSEDGRSVLVYYDGTNEFILGYITKGDVSNPNLVYRQYFSGSFGHSLNDLYNNVQDVDSVGSTMSKKKRTVLVGDSNFIGVVFHDTTSTQYGFNDGEFWKDKDYGRIPTDPLAPVAPLLSDESNFISLDGGNKIYHSSSGALEEFNAVRINVGVGGTDIHSFGDWTPSTLRVETPIERSIRSMAGITYASGSRSGSAGAFPEASTYHIFNYADNSSFFMGKNIIEIEKSNNDNTVFAKTVYDENGVLIEVDSAAVVRLKVNTAELIIDEGNITIVGANLNYHGNLYVSGNIIVSGTANLIGKATLDTELDVGSGKVIVDGTGKFLTTGGSDLA